MIENIAALPASQWVDVLVRIWQTSIIDTLTATNRTWKNDYRGVSTHMASQGHQAFSSLSSYNSIPQHSMRKKHGWPSTQPNRIAHNLAAHHRAAHNPAARCCAGSVVCNLTRQQCTLAERWPNVGTIVPTLGQRYPNVHCFLTGMVVKRVTHTGDTHNRASTPSSHWVVCSSVVCC